MFGALVGLKQPASAITPIITYQCTEAIQSGALPCSTLGEKTMESLNALILWPDNLLLSLLVLLVIAIPILYGARPAMHSLLQALFRGISNPLRLASHWLFKTADVLRERNKMVLLSRGREEISQSIVKEFDRVTALVERDLHGYPALQRKLTDEITRI